MDYIHSKEIIKKNNLIPRKISKKIINFINFENEKFENQKDLSLSKFITFENLNALRKKFQKFKKTKTNLKPRNLLVYEFIKKFGTKFEFNYNKKNFSPIMPELNGLRLSLSYILLSNLNLINNSRLIDESNIFNSFKRLIKICDFQTPSLKAQNEFLKLLIEIRKNNKKLVIITPCCPDYSKKKVGDKFEFTFETIEDGIGLVAERLALSCEEIYNFFDKLKVKYRHIISVGDFEAYSPSNQKKLNYSEGKYLDKIAFNQRQINEYFTNNEKIIKDKTFGNHFATKNEWLKKKSEILNKMKKKNYLQKTFSQKEIDEILNSRIPLYQRWYGDLSIEGYRNILFDQASEYAAMGYFIKKKYTNSIVIGADHHVMSKFYKLEQNLNVFYLRKNYIT